MNNIDILNSMGISIKSLKRKGKVMIVNNQYVLKDNPSKNKYYDYLQSRKFNYFPKVYSDNDIEVTEYIKEKDIPEEQKLEDIVYLASILHLDTTYDKNMDIDKIKEIYETTTDMFNNLFSYYQELQNIIEEEIYMSPSNYLLIRNMTLIYRCINLGKEFLNSWYKKVETTKSIRYVYTHGNLRKEHILENDNLYLISWNKSKIDFPITDILNFYRNSSLDINIKDILGIYEVKYPLKEEEKYLLFSFMLIPTKIDLNIPEYIKIKEVSNLVLYLNKTLDTLENYSKKTNNNTNK